MRAQNIAQNAFSVRPASAAAFFLGLLLMFSTTNLSAVDVLAAFIAFGTAVTVILKRNISVVLDVPGRALILFGSLVALQVLWYPQGFEPAAITLYLIGLFFCVRYWVQTHPYLAQPLVYGYVSGAVISAVLGVGAYVVRLATGGEVVSSLFWRGDVRVAGFFDDPNIYGAYLVPALVLLVWVFFTHTLDRRTSLLVFTGVSVLYSNILLSGSRGAWLNMAVALIFIGIINYRLFLSRIRKAVLLGVTAAALLVLLVFLVPVQNEATFFEYSLATRSVSSDAPRFENLQSAPEKIVERNSAEILLGSGTGAYQEESTARIAAHNTFLTVLYEQGALGIFLLLSVIAALCYKRCSRPLSPSSLLFLGLLLGLLIEAVYVDILHWRHFWVLLALI